MLTDLGKICSHISHYILSGHMSCAAGPGGGHGKDDDGLEVMIVLSWLCWGDGGGNPSEDGEGGGDGVGCGDLEGMVT